MRELELNGFERIPLLDIAFSMRALQKIYSKKVKVNDEVDISRISVGLPISNVMLTDRKRKSELIKLKFDQKYNCKIISGQKSDLEEYIYYLGQTI